MTAVEFLVEKIKPLYIGNFEITFLKEINQAKEMESQQQGYSEEEVLKAQQAILCNTKDALMNENYIIEYLNNLKTNKI
jgi:hypothetical protein